MVLDISDYEPPRAPSKTWRELIKKVWEVDPLTCLRCGSEMRIIGLIQDLGVICQILESLGSLEAVYRVSIKEAKTWVWAGSPLGI